MIYPEGLGLWMLGSCKVYPNIGGKAWYRQNRWVIGLFHVLPALETNHSAISWTWTLWTQQAIAEVHPRSQSREKQLYVAETRTKSPNTRNLQEIHFLNEFLPDPHQKWRKRMLELCPTAYPKGIILSSIFKKPEVRMWTWYSKIRFLGRWSISRHRRLLKS